MYHRLIDSLFQMYQTYGWNNTNHDIKLVIFRCVLATADVRLPAGRDQLIVDLGPATFEQTVACGCLWVLVGSVTVFFGPLTRVMSPVDMCVCEYMYRWVQGKNNRQ